jgi:pimeloyl-ACP methyl ester carboxylesterase
MPHRSERGLARGAVQLGDGRALEYGQWGALDGPVVLAFHGSPGSGIWWPGEAHTVAAGVRLIAPDRPGCGGSDPLTGRPIATWTSDVTELTAALGIDRFGVIGWSGGAPYAAAVAAALPDRLTGVCLASSASITYALDSIEFDEEDLHIVDLIERLGQIEATRQFAAENEAWADGVRTDPASLFPPDETAAGDRWFFDSTDLSAGLYDSLRDGLRQGMVGAATDWVGLVAPWGFSLGDIEPAVQLWHGAQDGGVSQDDFERVAAAIPNGTLTVWPGAGHCGIVKYWGDVLAAALG